MTYFVENLAPKRANKPAKEFSRRGNKSRAANSDANSDAKADDASGPIPAISSIDARRNRALARALAKELALNRDTEDRYSTEYYG